mmetsp:Transcript_13051/g.16940  ORF Transcript_13051/g.16940 Transcript_13051/m.16940 type:complete len:96 (-) Transcript_13051:63-350(-)
MIVIRSGFIMHDWMCRAVVFVKEYHVRDYFLPSSIARNSYNSFSQYQSRGKADSCFELVPIPWIYLAVYIHGNGIHAIQVCHALPLWVLGKEKRH